MTDWLVIYGERHRLSSDNADVPTVVSSIERPQGHYENFPVASWLCPPALRPPIGALYWFARTADDLADEGDADAAQRLDELAAYRAELQACAGGARAAGRWPGVFNPLAPHVQSGRLPLHLLLDLLSAFEQDVRHTRDGLGYATRDGLLDYCRRSANPVGRLLLHLHGVVDAGALAQSDAICTALQLINFWQDLGGDIARGRYYLSDEDCRAHGLNPRAPAGWAQAPGAYAAVRSVCDWAEGLMRAGAPLVRTLPGRSGWELRLVVQGGLRILRLIAAQQHDTFSRRPVLRRADALPMLWQALRM